MSSDFIARNERSTRASDLYSRTASSAGRIGLGNRRADGVQAVQARLGLHRRRVHLEGQPVVGHPHPEEPPVALLRRRGAWHDAEPEAQPHPDVDALADNEPGLAHLAATSVQGLLSVGPRTGQRLVRLFGQAASDEQHAPRHQTPGYGFNLHAGTRVAAHDKKGRERLCRYILRPPLAQDSLTELPDGRYQLRLKRAWSDGTRAVVFEGEDLCAKLAVMVPPPRMHRTRFFGVFSSHARLRSQVVPRPPAPAQAPSSCEQARADPLTDFTSRRRLRWARLMARVFDVDVLACPACASRMVMVKFVTEPTAIRRMLDAVGYAADSPTPAPRHASQTATG